MAEKITLVEVDIDTSKATKEAQSLKETSKLLKDELKKLKDAGKENTKESIELQAAIKTTNKEYNQQVNLIGKSIQADTAKSGSLDKQSAQLTIVTQKWRALSKDERTNTEEGKKLTKQKTQLTAALKKEEVATGDARRNVGNYGGQVEKATGALGSFVPAAGRATGVAKSFGVALKVALGPLGLIIAAIAALAAFFKSSEEGQSSLNKVIKIFGVILGNISDVVANFGEKLFNAIIKPKEAFENLKTRIQEIGDFFENTFGKVIKGSIDVFVGNLQKGFGKIGLAWQKFKGLFIDNTEKINKAQGKVDEANTKINEGFKKVNEGNEKLTNAIIDRWNKAKNAVTGFIEETQKEAKEAARLADLKLKTDRLERKALVERAKIESQVAELRLKAKKEDKFAASERLEFLREAGKLQDSLIEKDETIAKNRLELRRIENSFSKSTKENLDEEAKLQATVFNVQTARINAARSIERELQTVRKQNEAELVKLEKERLDATLNTLQLELEAWRNSREARLLIDEEYNALELEQRIEMLNVKFENELISEEEKNLAIQELTIEFEETERERKEEQSIIDYENELAVNESNIFATLELERKGLELKRKQELEFAKRIGADTGKINKKFAVAQRRLDQAEFQAKLSLAAGFTNNLAAIAGEQTAIGKAAAVASTTIATIQSAVSSFNSLSSIPVVGPVLGAAAAVAALASGYAQVKEILSVKSGLPGDSVSASVPSSGSGNVPSIPSVPATPREAGQASVGAGIVSRDNQTTESVSEGVSKALGENPMQPTIVTDDVTLSQEETFDNNQTTTL